MTPLDATNTSVWQLQQFPPPTGSNMDLDMEHQLFLQRRSQPARLSSYETSPARRSVLSSASIRSNPGSPTRLSHPSPAVLSQSTSSLRSRLDDSRIRSAAVAATTAASAASTSALRQSIRERTEYDQMWADTVARIRAEHEEALKAKEKQHTYEQADLLTAFQHDRTEAEKRHLAERSDIEQRHHRERTEIERLYQTERQEYERKCQEIIETLQNELRQTHENLSSHQSLYTEYSDKIKIELESLRSEVATSRHKLETQHATLAQQSALIHQLQSDAESAVIDRQHWERDLVQQSNDILRLKQESFDAERHERDACIQALTQQLETLTRERTHWEKEFKKEEERSNLLQAKVDSFEAKSRETESILKAQRALHTEVTTGYVELEKAYAEAQADAKKTRVDLQRTEGEYQEMSQLYSQLSHDTGERIRLLQSESTHLREACDQSRRTNERLTREVTKSHSDRVALQHAFLKLHARARLRKLVHTWICRTQARQWRAREMTFLMNRTERHEKRAILQRWLMHARMETVRMKERVTTERKLEHVARQFHDSKRRDVMVKAFRQWADDAKRAKRVTHVTQDHPVSSFGHSIMASPSSIFPPSSLASALDLERQKKIDLFHLLQHERATWADQRQQFEAQLRTCELARQQEQTELASLHRALEEMRGEHQKLQADVQRKLQAESDVQKAVHDTIIADQHQQTPLTKSYFKSSLPVHPSSLPSTYPSLSHLRPSFPSASPPTNLPPPSSSPLHSPSPSPLPFSRLTAHSVDQAKQDLRFMLDNMQVQSMSQSKQAELQYLQNSIQSEQARLATLTQLRQEREAAEQQVNQELEPPTKNAQPFTSSTLSSSTKQKAHARPKSIMRERPARSRSTSTTRKSVQFH